MIESSLIPEVSAATQFSALIKRAFYNIPEIQRATTHAGPIKISIGRRSLRTSTPFRIGDILLQTELIDHPAHSSKNKREIISCWVGFSSVFCLFNNIPFKTTLSTVNYTLNFTLAVLKVLTSFNFPTNLTNSINRCKI